MNYGRTILTPKGSRLPSRLLVSYRDFTGDSEAKLRSQGCKLEKPPEDLTDQVPPGILRCLITLPDAKLHTPGLDLELDYLQTPVPRIPTTPELWVQVNSHMFRVRRALRLTRILSPLSSTGSHLDPDCTEHPKGSLNTALNKNPC